MEKDETLAAHDTRRTFLRTSADDVLVKSLGIPYGDYECVMVDNSWPEKSLVEGDIVVCAGGRSAMAGDIVLLEEQGRVRLGILAEPGRLETRQGSRPLELSERIIAVGVAVVRKLPGGSIDFAL